MKELYWLSVLGNIHEIAMGFTIMFVFIVACVIVAYIIACFAQNQEETSKTKKLLITCIAYLILLTLLSSFLPSKKELYVIYGVGKTLDYLQGNEDAKELPDNVIKTLNKLAEEYAKEDEKRHEKE